jgi:hypothetical protein
METIKRKVLVSYGSEPTRTKIIQIPVVGATFLKANVFDILKSENSIHLLGGSKT